MTALDGSRDKYSNKRIQVIADADLILELLANRQGFVEDAESLMELAQSSELEVYITDKCLKRLRLEHNREELTNQAIQFISRAFEQRIIEITPLIREKARLRNIVDLDSAEEYVCAVDNELDAIVTCNPRNFTGSNLPIWSAKSLPVCFLLESLLYCEPLQYFNRSSEVTDVGNRDEIQEFNKMIRDFLNPSSLEGRSIISSIRYLMDEFKVYEHCDEADILNTAYLRGISTIDKGYPIYSPEAWLKETCLTIVKEKSLYR